MKYFVRIIALLFVTYGALLLISCSNNDIPTPTPEPETEPEVTFVLKLKSTDIVDFKKIKGGKTTDIAQGEAKTIFGKRIELITPSELQFDGDSLSIVKGNGIVEHYAIKWQDGELFLHSDVEDNWEYCGKRSDDGRFILNTGMFSRVAENEQRKLFITGQDYSLTSHDKLLANADDVVVWLRMEFVFEK
ncbi:MAG: hypothetical protein GX670_08250 [Bacteroidales bacterium]|nr:hypothetical protein [Bacteroidales bacterium]